MRAREERSGCFQKLGGHPVAAIGRRRVAFRSSRALPHYRTFPSLRLRQLEVLHFEPQLLRRNTAHIGQDCSTSVSLVASVTHLYDPAVTSGMMIREARLRAGLSQVELSDRSGKDRAQIARWERDVVQPSFETLRELVRACGFDLDLRLVPYDVDDRESAQLRKSLLRSPQERLQTMLKARGR